MKVVEIINYLIGYSWEGFLLIENVLIDMSYELIDNYDVREKVIEEYADIKTKSFRRLIEEINRINISNNEFQKLILEERIDGYYIMKRGESSLNAEKYMEVISLLSGLESRSNKGTEYEKFCKQFLIDLGISCKLTQASNDKGIDILGSFKVKLSEEIGDLVFSEEIYVLVQTKYFNKKIDTPVIRKLVGDSLFIRFDELEYVEIRHNAFHLIVFSHSGFTEPAITFARRNKIKLFDSTQIAHIISEKPTKEWTCLNI